MKIILKRTVKIKDIPSAERLARVDGCRSPSGYFAEYLRSVKKPMKFEVVDLPYMSDYKEFERCVHEQMERHGLRDARHHDLVVFAALFRREIRKIGSIAARDSDPVHYVTDSLGYHRISTDSELYSDHRILVVKK